jgi:hypothetical protein
VQSGAKRRAAVDQSSGFAPRKRRRRGCEDDDDEEEDEEEGEEEEEEEEDEEEDEDEDEDEEEEEECEAKSLAQVRFSCLCPKSNHFILFLFFNPFQIVPDGWSLVQATPTTLECIQIGASVVVKETAVAWKLTTVTAKYSKNQGKNQSCCYTGEDANVELLYANDGHYDQLLKLETYRSLQYDSP